MIFVEFMNRLFIVFGHLSHGHVIKCHVQNLEASASHPLPLLEGVPQVLDHWRIVTQIGPILSTVDWQSPIRITAQHVHATAGRFLSWQMPIVRQQPALRPAPPTLQLQLTDGNPAQTQAPPQHRGNDWNSGH